MWLLFLLLFLIFPNPTLAVDFEQNSSTIITAAVGENRVTIYGYTSPNSKVELSNSEVYSLTYSNDTGYFNFDKILLPKETLSDLCLNSTDNNSRQSTPVCFSPPPETNYHTDIGPILLPPTISLEKSDIDPNSTVVTSGQAIPNSQVNINFYKVNDSAQAFGVKQVYAYSLPSVTATTDEFGNFSLNLPTAYASDYRLYATAKFNDNYSPKSNTLIYILPSLFYLFLQQHHYLIFLIPSVLLTLIAFFVFLNFKKHKTRYLPAIRKFLPAIKPYPLTPFP